MGRFFIILFSLLFVNVSTAQTTIDDRLSRERLQQIDEKLTILEEGITALNQKMSALLTKSEPLGWSCAGHCVYSKRDGSYEDYYGIVKSSQSRATDAYEEMVLVCKKNHKSAFVVVDITYPIKHASLVNACVKN